MTTAQALSGLLILLIAIAAANAPFVTERLLGVARLAHGKSLGLRLSELVVYYLVTLALAVLIETRFGPRYPQGWEFYGITSCLFVVLGYPGFVWRYLRRASASREQIDLATPSDGDPR